MPSVAAPVQRVTNSWAGVQHEKCSVGLAGDSIREQRPPCRGGDSLRFVTHPLASVPPRNRQREPPQREGCSQGARHSSGHSGEEGGASLSRAPHFPGGPGDRAHTQSLLPGRAAGLLRTSAPTVGALPQSTPVVTQLAGGSCCLGRAETKGTLRGL